MRVVLIDSGGANIGSVRYALQRLGLDAPLSGDAAEIRAADRVILPGVGAAAPAMARLRELGLVETIRSLSQPLLGICLGMQLLFEASEEGEVETLGLLPGRVARLRGGPGLRVPHMGWNRLELRGRHPLLDGIQDGARAYFVHGYAAPVTADCVAACTHGAAFAAVVARGNVCGAQFHPERSAAVGARILANFLQPGGCLAAAA
jgi:imidazole glycerol-phosphate synthase subunit HisH